MPHEGLERESVSVDWRRIQCQCSETLVAKREPDKHTDKHNAERAWCVCEKEKETERKTERGGGEMSNCV
jgi:hypothetical protein